MNNIEPFHPKNKLSSSNLPDGVLGFWGIKDGQTSTAVKEQDSPSSKADQTSCHPARWNDFALGVARDLVVVVLAQVSASFFSNGLAFFQGFACRLPMLCATSAVASTLKIRRESTRSLTMQTVQEPSGTGAGRTLKPSRQRRRACFGQSC